MNLTTSSGSINRAREKESLTTGGRKADQFLVLRAKQQLSSLR